MIHSETWLDILSDEQIIDFINNKTTIESQEHRIYSKLLKLEINRVRYEELKKESFAQSIGESLNKFKELSKKSQKSNNYTKNLITPLHPAPGQIWSVKREPKWGPFENVFARNYYVYLFTHPTNLELEHIDLSTIKDNSEKEVVEFFPVSEYVQYKSKFDYELGIDISPLGIPCIVETDLIGEILVKNLASFIGYVPSEIKEKILNMHLIAHDLDGDIELYNATIDKSTFCQDLEDVDEFKSIETDNIQLVESSLRELRATQKSSILINSRHELVAGSSNLNIERINPEKKEVVIDSKEFDLVLYYESSAGVYISMNCAFKNDPKITLVIKSLSNEKELFRDNFTNNEEQFRIFNCDVKNEFLEFTVFLDEQVYLTKGVLC